MKITTKKLLGRRIKELRKAKGLSQDQLSEEVDIDSKHLSRIEVGNNYPSLDTLERLAKALHVEMKDLFEFTHQGDMRHSIARQLEKVDRKTLRVIHKFFEEFI